MMPTWRIKFTPFPRFSRSFSGLRPSRIDGALASSASENNHCWREANARGECCGAARPDASEMSEALGIFAAKSFRLCHPRTELIMRVSVEESVVSSDRWREEVMSCSHFAISSSIDTEPSKAVTIPQFPTSEILSLRPNIPAQGNLMIAAGHEKQRKGKIGTHKFYVCACSLSRISGCSTFGTTVGLGPRSRGH